MLRIIPLIFILITLNNSYGGRGLDTGGGGHVMNSDFNNVKIELLKLQRVDGESGYSFVDARPDLKRLSTSSISAEAVAKMLQIRVMTKLEDISEITLKDGTVLRVEEMLK